MEIWLIVLLAVAALILLLFAFALLTYFVAFGKRYAKNSLLKYFSAEDLSLIEESFALGKIAGRIYTDKSAVPRDEIIVFVHGMGPGHIAYTTEIAYFCRLGYTVLASDSLGCGNSGGRNIKGMYEGVKTAVKTIRFARQKYSGRKIFIVGHSWGGYSVLCASAEIKVDKVVSISAPTSPVKTIYYGAARIISKPFAALLCPFWYVINFFKFGAKGNASAIKCARKNGTPTLLVHGGKDFIVPPLKAAYYGVYGENVTKFLDENKAHNPYNTVEAEAVLSNVSKALSKCKTMTEEERKAYFSAFDIKAATEEDEAVMSVIAEFLSK